MVDELEKDGPPAAEKGHDGVTRISILIADGSRMFSEGLAMALWWESDLHVINDFPISGQDALASALKHKPDVLLADYWLPGMNGVAVASALSKRAPDLQVILLTLFEEPSQKDEAYAAGAARFFNKSVSVEEIVRSVRKVHHGHTLVDREHQRDAAARRLADRGHEAAVMRERLALLTPRELNILQLLGSGRGFQRIAKELSMTPATVRAHARNISKKANVPTKEQAVAMARFCGIIH